MQDDNDIADDGRDLWAGLAADITPLQRRNHRAPEPVRKLKAGAVMRARDDAAVMRDALEEPLDPVLLETGDETSFRRAGIRPATLRKLRRGQFRIQAELDLHGHTRRAARAALTDFLAEAARADLRCLRIIHGKGLRSPRGEPVLKARVEISLQRDQRVLAYASAPPWLGGHGAVLVLLNPR